MYVCIESGDIVGVFAYTIGEDETYRVIRDGQWLNDELYGTIHRIASSGAQKGISTYCFSWAFEQCPNIRIDTHEDNKVMQRVLQKNNFVYCGVITTRDGTSRMAYQKKI